MLDLCSCQGNIAYRHCSCCVLCVSKLSWCDGCNRNISLCTCQHVLLGRFTYLYQRSDIGSDGSPYAYVLPHSGQDRTGMLYLDQVSLIQAIMCDNSLAH